MKILTEQPKNSKWVILVFALVLFSLITKMIFKDYHLNKNRRFTIATIEKVEGTKGGRQALFFYYYNDKKYYGSGSSDMISMNMRDHRFFLILNKNNPSSCKLLIESPVPDSIKIAPIRGWDSLPSPNGIQ